MKIKEDIPNLTVAESVQVPSERSKSQREMILLIWCFLGGILGCGLIFGGDWLREQGINHKLLDKLIGPAKEN